MAGLQQRELAERAGLDPSHVSLIEKGTRKPSLSAISKLCQAMRIPESLFTMLAAEPEDLKGIEQEEFEAIGRYLARFVIQHEGPPDKTEEHARIRKPPRSA